MTDRVLTLRELNRATLARQMLLSRQGVPALEAVERLVGLQAQVTAPPYVGLWTRLRGFRREELTGLMEQRLVVRATLMRTTLHLMAAEDYALLRPTLQPALTRSMSSIASKQLEGLDVDELTGAARAYFEEKPRTFAELRSWLAGIQPDRDPNALAYAVRTHLPLVQVPSGGRWGYAGNAPYTTAESWLGRPLSGSAGLRKLVRRYLAAFGPATVMDVQKWSGLTRLKHLVEEMKPELRSYKDESGRELLDLPDAPLPEAGIPAPVRFVPDYDNLVLAHAERRRVIADEYRSRIFLSAARVRATFLVDGFVQGAWKIEKSKGTATLVIEPFITLSRGARDVLAEEGEQLVRFVEDGAKHHEIRFAEQTSP